MITRTSRLFWPILVTPKNATVKSVEAISRSQKLMTELGLIKPASSGTFQIMPLGQRSVDKCVDIINRHMAAVDGQRITLPILTSSALWKKSGRLDGDVTEFYMLRDRHSKEFLLSPTHEEAVTAMLATAAPISYRQLPLRLYQIGPKFRDELKSRFGLIRAKEFVMKDMYTFDRTFDDAQLTYNALNEAYNNLFKKIQVPFVRVSAATGMMGGSMSHEYHYTSEAGEDRIYQCSQCGFASNAEVDDKLEICTNCKSKAGFIESRGIEVGHTFLLGDKYSKAMGATFLHEKGKPENLIMGCYGIGVTRLIAAALEFLSTDTDLRWPTLLAPYDICIIGPKTGSKEQLQGDVIEETFCNTLVNMYDKNEILLDDRKYLTIGKRLMDAKRMGYPIVVVIGSKAVHADTKFELHLYNTTLELSLQDTLAEILKYKTYKSQLFDVQPTEITHRHPLGQDMLRQQY